MSTYLLWSCVHEKFGLSPGPGQRKFSFCLDAHQFVLKLWLGICLCFWIFTFRTSVKLHRFYSQVTPLMTPDLLFCQIQNLCLWSFCFGLFDAYKLCRNFQTCKL
jgi:hypothetical protein